MSICPPRPRLRHSGQTDPQTRFWGSDARFRAFIGGVGSGKTRAGCVEAIRQPEDSTGMVLAPTYPMLRDATLRTFLELVRPAGILADFNKAEMRADLIDGKTILFRSADNPDRLRGPNLGWFWLDEAALMPRDVWLIMLGRLREAPGRAWVTSTPRGKNWLYHEFIRGGDEYAIIKASSRTNPFLPGAFIGSLERSYSELFKAQEVEGEFVDDQTDALLPGDWLEACSDAPHRRAGPARLAADLGGGSGGDRTVLIVRDDNGVLALEHSRTWSLEVTAGRVAMLAQRYHVEPHRISWDQPGIGHDFGNRLAAVGLRGCMAYGGGLSGGDQFANLRSAAAWALRRRLDPQHRNTKTGFALPPFAIKSEWLDLMRDELLALRWTIDKDRLIALEKKEEYVANLGHSPDFADCLGQSFAFKV